MVSTDCSYTNHVCLPFGAKELVLKWVVLMCWGEMGNKSHKDETQTDPQSVGLLHYDDALYIMMWPFANI